MAAPHRPREAGISACYAAIYAHNYVILGTVVYTTVACSVNRAAYRRVREHVALDATMGFDYQ